MTNYQLQITSYKFIFLSVVFVFLLLPIFTNAQLPVAPKNGVPVSGETPIQLRESEDTGSPFTGGQSGDEGCYKQSGTCVYGTCSKGTHVVYNLCMSRPTDSNYHCCVPDSSSGSLIGGDNKDTSSGRLSGGNKVINIPNPLGSTTTFTELIQRIIKWLLIIGAPVLTLMILIGAFQLMTAGGRPENITKGRHTITYAVIGYALLLLSTALIMVIEKLLKG